MKKLFSLFATLLFAGSMFAAEVQIYKNEGVAGTDDAGITVTGNINTTASNGNPAPAFGNTSNKNTTFTFEGFAVSAYSNLRLSVDACFKNFPATTNTWPYLEVKFYKSGTVVQTNTTTVAWTEKVNTYSNYSIDISNDFDKIEFIGHPAIGKTGSGNDATNYGTYFDNVTLWGESSQPTIVADDVELGEVMYEPGGQFQTEISIDVVSANLTSDIDISLPAVTNLSITSPASGTLEMNTPSTIIALLTATAGEIDDQIVLISGETTKTISIKGSVFEKLYNPGTGVTDAAFVTPAATDTAYLVDNDENAYTVNGDLAIKVGTSAKLGKAKIKVPANAKKLYVMAAAWASKACNITVTAPDGVTLSSDSINEQGKVHLYADAGLTGNGPAYQTQKGDLSLYQYEFELSGLTGETVIEFASTTRSNARFLLWNITYTTDIETAIDNTELTEKAVKTIENGQLVIIKNGKTFNAQGQQVR